MWFAAGFQPIEQDISLRDLARAVGLGIFEALTVGPFPVQGGATPPFLTLHALDLDADGALDVVGINPQLATWQTLAFRPEPFEARLLPAFGPQGAAEGAPDCSQPTGHALGDFVEGDGPDLLVLGGFDVAPGEPAEFGRCVYANDGAGAFAEATADTRVAAPSQGVGVARVADLDGDGHLDAFFDVPGVVAFGDGAGGFTEVALPEACTALQARQLIPERATALIDFDRDGDLDLMTPELVYVDGGAVVIPPCLILNNGDRTFDASPLPGIPAQPNENCIGRCYSIEVEGFDNDGWDDLYLFDADELMMVALRRGDTFSPLSPAATWSDGARAVSFSDFNGDGRVDVALGRGDADALLDLGDGIVTRAAEGKPLHVGVGDRATVSVGVRYPGGGTATLNGLPAGARGLVMP